MNKVLYYLWLELTRNDTDSETRDVGGVNAIWMKSITNIDNEICTHRWLFDSCEM